MNYDEFAFFNQQLAAMLRDGIPLEGALRQLSAGMRTGPLRAEMQKLEADLASGTPLNMALGRRDLPEFYKRMIVIGARSDDLPGVLTMIADHYQRAQALWTRLKGLMTYPLIVILVSLGLTLMLSFVFGRFLTNFFYDMVGGHGNQPYYWAASMWFPPAILAMVAVLGVAAVSIPGWRAKLRWRLPAFREASLSQLASAIALMLKNGTTLAEALTLAQALEANTPAGKTLEKWRHHVETGEGRTAQWPIAEPFPPLFLWLVQRSGEDPAAGFQKAAEIYQARASYKIEIALYGALPVSILLLGQMVFWQVAPLMKGMTWFMQTLGSD